LLSELDVDKEENSRLGVYWLIKASEQGNIEATHILKHCLETGQGEFSWDSNDSKF
jgi:wolfamin